MSRQRKGERETCELSLKVFSKDLSIILCDVTSYGKMAWISKSKYLLLFGN